MYNERIDQNNFVKTEGFTFTVNIVVNNNNLYIFNNNVVKYQSGYLRNLVASDLSGANFFKTV